MAMDTDEDHGELAQRMLAALDEVRQVEPPSAARPEFALADAYRISGEILALRHERGERVVGWKIGFTNRGIWDEYGVHAPIWGPVYAHTLFAAGSAGMPSTASLSHLPEPRIEPEIVFRLSATPRRGMGEAELLQCVDAVGPSFEIVQSIFPAWKFRPADTVAAFAMHGGLHCGPLVGRASLNDPEWLDALASFRLTLLRDGLEVETGEAASVLGGPLSALKHFVDGFDAIPFARGLESGDLVTTGTVTRAYPIEPGQTWETRLEGLPISGIAVAFG